MSPRGAGPDQPKRAAPGKPPVVGVEKVTCACGHEADLPLFDDRRDRLYRDVRRKKLAAGPCPDCRRQAHAELTARQQAEAAQRKPARPAPPAPKQKASQPPAGRLPDGSEFRVTYDAAAERWVGTLTVTARGAARCSRARRAPCSACWGCWTGSTAPGWPPRPRRPPAGRRAAAGGPGDEGGACSALRWAGRWACWLVQLLRSTDEALQEVAAACRAVRAALAGLRQRAEQRRGRPRPEYSPLQY